jgi:hypothetical protein
LKINQLARLFKPISAPKPFKAYSLKLLTIRAAFKGQNYLTPVTENGCHNPIAVAALFHPHLNFKRFAVMSINVSPIAAWNFSLRCASTEEHRDDNYIFHCLLILVF